MKICLIGSTGFLGKVVLRKALERGLQVRVLVRTPEKLGEFCDKLEPDDVIVGNVFHKEDVEAAVDSTEAVVSVYGPQKNPDDPKVYERAMENLVAIMSTKRIRRLIHVGGAVHDGGQGEEWSFGRLVLRFFLNLVYGNVLELKRLEWEVLKRSEGIDWTLVRPPRIAPSKPQGMLIANEKRLASLQVWVEDLADFLLDQLESEEWIGKAPLVAAG